MDACTVLAVLLTKHWYKPECAVVGEGISIVPPLMVSPPLGVSSSPLKYHTTSGAGVPATVQKKESGSPTNWSSLFGETSEMKAGSAQ